MSKILLLDRIVEFLEQLYVYNDGNNQTDILYVDRDRRKVNGD